MGITQEYLRVANIKGLNPNDQPYVAALGTDLALPTLTVHFLFLFPLQILSRRPAWIRQVCRTDGIWHGYVAWSRIGVKSAVKATAFEALDLDGLPFCKARMD